MDENELRDAMQNHRRSRFDTGPRKVFKPSSMLHDAHSQLRAPMNRSGVKRLSFCRRSTFPVFRIGSQFHHAKFNMRDSLAMEK